MDVGGDPLAQRQDAGRRRIAVMAVAQRFHGRLDDMRRRGKVRLADAEVDDVMTLAGKFGRSRQHGEGILLADPVEGRDGGQHRFAPFFRFRAHLCGSDARLARGRAWRT